MAPVAIVLAFEGAEGMIRILILVVEAAGLRLISQHPMTLPPLPALIEPQFESRILRIRHICRIVNAPFPAIGGPSAPPIITYAEGVELVPSPVEETPPFLSRHPPVC